MVRSCRTLPCLEEQDRVLAALRELGRKDAARAAPADLRGSGKVGPNENENDRTRTRTRDVPERGALMSQSAHRPAWRVGSCGVDGASGVAAVEGDA